MTSHHERPTERDHYEREVTTDLKDETPDVPKGPPLHTRILIGLLVGVSAGLGANATLGANHPAVAWTVRNVTEPVGTLFLRMLLMIVVPLVFSALVVGVAGVGEMRTRQFPPKIEELGRRRLWLGLLFLVIGALSLAQLVVFRMTSGWATAAKVAALLCFLAGFFYLLAHWLRRFQLARIGLATLFYTVVFSAISVAIGLTIANTLRPGERISAETAAGLQQRYGGEAAQRLAGTPALRAGAADSAPMQVVKTMVPANPFAAASSETPNMLHLMFLAVIVGVATTLIPQTASEPLLKILQAVFDVSAKVVDIVMRLAPYAVACLLFNNTARFGLDLLGALAWYIAAVTIGLSLHMFGVYSLAVRFLARISPLEFFRRIKTAMLTAFSTSSSNATLPTALRVTEENLGVPREISSFVLTVGATANQNGTALYEGVTVLFLAQLAGVDLSLGKQLLVAYLAILGGIGTAGVPGGSIPFVIVVLATVGVDPALIAIILGVDRILDMMRTTLNVTGDIAAAAYVARSEGYSLAVDR